jgi:hypothetical protein
LNFSNKGTVGRKYAASKIDNVLDLVLRLVNSKALFMN